MRFQQGGVDWEEKMGWFFCTMCGMKVIQVCKLVVLRMRFEVDTYAESVRLPMSLWQ